MGFEESNISIALGQQRKPIAKAVNLSMHSRHNNYSCNALFSVVDNITTYLPQTRINLDKVDIPTSIQLADDDFKIPGEVSFLLAADIFFKIMLPEKTALVRDELFLLATKFGYIVSGKISASLPSAQGSDKVGLHVALDLDKSHLDTLLQRFWEEQNVPEIKIQGTDSKNVCEIEFQKSTQLIENRFQVKLPLKVPIEEVCLGDSFSVALQRLNALCKRFKKDAQLKKCYTEFINEFIALGHARVIDLFKLDMDLDCCYFLPHHAVVKEDSTTTRLRAVFDGSAKTNLGLSLNNILESGPVVQKELFDILVLFRTYKYVAMTDIKQMYRQVVLDPSQAHLQLILWKENLDDPLTCLQITRIIYGLTSSSFLATRCLVELAQRYERQYPLASAVLRNNSYVDDCLFGASTLDEVRQACDELIELTRRGSFELHKWCANHQDILAGIPKSKRRFQEIDLNNTELTTKALGLSLNLISDEFIISKPVGPLPTQWTKRTVLSFIGTFFDPLGLAGPILTKAKEFLQKVWRQRLGWDVSIPDELLSSWSSFFQDLMSMRSINVKRDLMLSGADSVQLIGYCDASFIAFSACIYIRAVHGEDVYVTLLCSKSRIAPIKDQRLYLEPHKWILQPSRLPLSWDNAFRVEIQFIVVGRAP
ncbi:uncharacterized protein [Choristoneura fumiferana]|uniref:uncharacterized protein n=1 Tax=Choristoneura fumiferana TaxID=7141 RepID=UPI003D15C4BC